MSSGVNQAGRNPNIQIGRRPAPQAPAKTQESGKAGGIQTVNPQEAKKGASTTQRTAGLDKSAVFKRAEINTDKPGRQQTITIGKRQPPATAAPKTEPSNSDKLDRLMDIQEKTAAGMTEAREKFDKFKETGEGSAEAAHKLMQVSTEARNAAIDMALLAGAEGPREALEKTFPGGMGLAGLHANDRAMITELVNQHGECQTKLEQIKAGSVRTENITRDAQIHNMPDGKRADNVKNNSENYDLYSSEKRQVTGSRKEKQEAIAHNKKIDAAYKKVGDDITPKSLTRKKVTPEEKELGINQMKFNLKTRLQNDTALAAAVGKNPDALKNAIVSSLAGTGLSPTEKGEVTDELFGVMKNSAPSAESVTSMKPLGASGANGTLYKAVFDGKEVAVKEMSADKFDDEVKMFQALENNSNVTRFMGAYVVGDKAYVVSELVNGYDIEKMGDQKLEGAPPEDRAKICNHVAGGIIDAVSSMHENGLLHVDFKSQNIMIDKETMTAKMIDFGSVSEMTADGKLTAAATPTYQYLSVVGDNLRQLDSLPPDMREAGEKYLEQKKLEAEGKLTDENRISGREMFLIETKIGTRQNKDMEAVEVGALGHVMADIIVGSNARLDNIDKTIMSNNPTIKAVHTYNYTESIIHLDPISNRGMLTPDQYDTDAEVYTKPEVWGKPEMKPMADAIRVLTQPTLQDRPSMAQLKAIRNGETPPLSQPGEFGIKTEADRDKLVKALSPNGVYSGGQELMFQHLGDK